MLIFLFLSGASVLWQFIRFAVSNVRELRHRMSVVER